MKFARLSILLAFWILLPGCTRFNVIEPIVVQVADCVDESVAEVRDELCAEVAWLRWRKLFRDQPFQHDFAAGFRSGYEDVIKGGSGSPPMIPPRYYWRRCFENAHGRQKAQVWFQGYHYGAIAAEQDGAGIWYELPLNRPPEEGTLDPSMLAPHYDGEVVEVLPPDVQGPVIIDQGQPEPRFHPDSAPLPETTWPDEEPPRPEHEAPARGPGPTMPDAEFPAPDGIPIPPLEPNPEP